MFPPKLTADQKEHHRLAHRSNAQVGNTWALFNMYLQMDKAPQIALEMAEKAMEVWIPWEDSRVIEYPDIDPPDFREMIKGVAVQIGQEARQMKEGGLLEAMNEGETNLAWVKDGLEGVEKGSKAG